MRRVIGIGETILDIVFKEDGTLKAIPGGSTFNALVSLSRMGIESLLISEFGQDQVGNLLADFMQKNGMTTHYIDRFHTGQSPISLAFLDSNKKASYQFYTSYPQQRLKEEFPIVKKNDLILFGSYYAVNPTIRERVFEFLLYAKKQGAILYYDLNFRPSHAHQKTKLEVSFVENFELADIIKGSDEDFQTLYQLRDAKTVYQKTSYYSPLLIYTKGIDGVDLYAKEFSLHVDSKKIQPISTIGAGDNFNAGVLYTLSTMDISAEKLKNMTHIEWKKILENGIEFASQVCCQEENYLSADFCNKEI